VSAKDEQTRRSPDRRRVLGDELFGKLEVEIRDIHRLIKISAARHGRALAA
jgi:hypothetical protein